MEFSNPAVRRYVTQISASPHPISLSQTNHYSFSFLGFQIAILNSPTQFLSLTLSFPLVISLSVVSLVCVYGCLAVDLDIAILVGMWLCMHVDVNECNVCSVCMFLILGLLFRIAEVFALSHCGFDFCQIASIMVFNILNTNLCAFILNDWIMITLFCICLFHWRIWS